MSIIIPNISYQNLKFYWEKKKNEKHLDKLFFKKMFTNYIHTVESNLITAFFQHFQTAPLFHKYYNTSCILKDNSYNNAFVIHSNKGFKNGKLTICTISASFKS